MSKQISFALKTLATACFLATSSANHISAQININTVNKIIELDRHFPADRKEFSPLTGVIWNINKLPYKFYTYCPGKRVIKTSNGHAVALPVVKRIEECDATTALVFQLFHMQDNTFSHTTTPTKPASYLQASDIGDIVTVLCKAYDMSHKVPWFFDYNSVQAEIKNTRDTLNRDYLHKPKNILTAENKEFIGQKNKTIKAQELIIMPESSVRKQLHDIIFNAAQKANSSASRKKAQNKIDDLVQVLIDACKESCLIITNRKIQPLYVMQTPISLLLSFMCSKLTKFSELEDYCSHIPTTNMNIDWHECFESDHFYAPSHDLTWLGRECLTAADKAKFMQENYGDFIFGYMEHFGCQDFPPMHHNMHLEKLHDNPLGDRGLTDCAETAVFNFILTLLTGCGSYNCVTKKFNTETLLSKLSHLFKTKNVAYDEEKLKSGCMLLEKILSYLSLTNIDNKLVHEMILDIISNRPGVWYLRAQKSGVCENANFKKYFVHASPGMDQESDGNPLENRDNTYFLYEPMGMPWNWVALVNDLFGLHSQSLHDLLTLFNITVSTADHDDEFITNTKNHKELLNRADKYSKTNNTQLRLFVPCKLSTGTNFDLHFTFTGGHADCWIGILSDNTNFRQNLNNFLLTALETNSCACIQQNVISCLNSGIIKKLPNLPEYPPADHQHICLSQNLSDDETFNYIILSLCKSSGQVLKPFLINLIKQLESRNSNWLFKDGSLDCIYNNSATESTTLALDKQVVCSLFKLLWHDIQHIYPSTLINNSAAIVNRVPSVVLSVAELLYCLLYTSEAETVQDKR